METGNTVQTETTPPNDPRAQRRDPDQATAAAEADARRDFPIPKNQGEARTLYTQLHASLPDRFPGTGDRSRDPEFRGFARHLAQLGAVAFAPAPVVAFEPDAEKILAAEATMAGLTTLRDRYPAGSEHARRYEGPILKAQAAITAAQEPPAPPSGWAYTDADATRAAEQDGWTPDRIAQGRGLRQAFGLTPLEGEQYRLEVREALRPWAGQAPPSSDDLDLDELWGKAVNENIEAVGRVRTLLQRQFPGEWQAVVPYLGIAGVVQALAKVGRLATR